MGYVSLPEGIVICPDYKYWYFEGYWHNCTKDKLHQPPIANNNSSIEFRIHFKDILRETRVFRGFGLNFHV